MKQKLKVKSLKKKTILIAVILVASLSLSGCSSNAPGIVRSMNINPNIVTQKTKTKTNNIPMSSQGSGSDTMVFDIEKVGFEYFRKRRLRKKLLKTLNLLESVSNNTLIRFAVI